MGQQVRWPEEEEEPKSGRPPLDPFGLVMFTFPAGWVFQLIRPRFVLLGLVLIVALLGILALIVSAHAHPIPESLRRG